MKRMLLLSAYFLMTLVLFAGPVTKEQAQQIASQFLTSKRVSHRAPSTEQLKAEVVLNAVDEAGQPYLYAVTQDEGDGFVIVSGDDRFREVLGYSNSGTFDSTNMPDNMRAWLQGYVDEMKHLKAIGYQPTASASRRASGVKTAIAPLVQTTWDQDEPYNNLCYFSNGSQYKTCVTGCVATAMAQVIYYASMKAGKQPAKTIAEIPGYTSTKYGYIVPSIAAETELDWNNMLLNYDTGSPTDAQKEAVATLMLCCGASVQMNYGMSSSGASTSDVAPALIKYFGYDETTRFVSRSNYSLSMWTELMYSELAAQRPVLYGGQSSGGGHAFVVDGYDGDELFHVNWGWSGYCDNYFALSVMNPDDNSGIGASTSNDGYSFDQDAVIGIQIASGQTYTEAKHMSFEDLTVSGSTISSKAWNMNNETLAFDYGYAYVDSEGNLEVISGIHENWEFGYLHGYPVDATISGTAKPAGTYKIVRISRVHGTADWVVQDNEYVEAEFDGSGNVVLTKRPIVSLATTAFNFTGSKVVNESQPVEVTIQNNGDEFYGTLFLFASQTSTKGKYQNYGGVTIVKGKSSTMTFEFEPTSTGTYNIWIATDENGTNVIGTTTVSILASPAVEYTDNITLTITQNVLNADGTEVYGKYADVEFTITNNTNNNYRGAIYLGTWKWTGGSGSASISSQTEVVPANSSIVITRKSYELSGATNYSFTPYYDKNGVRTRIDTDIYKYYTTTDGYTTYDTNGNPEMKKAEAAIAVANGVSYVDLRGQTTTHTITSQANPNTLFLVDEGYSLTGATNVIQETASGYTAANIVLEDNANGFTTPVDFTATKISYTRTIDKYYNAGKGWTTVVLPFAASKVENNAGNLPWDEANRKFWLMEFNGESSSTVNFATASSPLKANTPYIIAIPGANYGTQSLAADGKNTLTFSADDVTVKAGAKAAVTVLNYKFIGTMTNTGSLDDIYALNNDGDTFKKGTATVEPFRAYFAATSTAATATSLGIGFGKGNTTGIEELKLSTTDVKREGVYNLNGQRVTQPRKGLYIMNGKKVVIK